MPFDLTSSKNQMELKWTTSLPSYGLVEDKQLPTPSPHFGQITALPMSGDRKALSMSAYLLGYMRILLNKGENRVIVPYLHQLGWVPHRRLETIAALSKKRRLLLPDTCRMYYSAEQCRIWGGDDAKKKRVVVVMGATGTGKSKLSIELATRFSGDVVNCDKIQVYRGLDITTNKIPLADRCSVPHHLLSELDPAAGELSPVKFREMAASTIDEITDSGRIPVLAGGSNSFLHAAMAGSYDLGQNPFGAGWKRRGWKKETLRYRCCFLWVHVEAATLSEHLDRRVEEMLGSGLVSELERYFSAEEGAAGEFRHPGLGKAIGVAEFREYFKGREKGTAVAYEAAVAAIKVNTRRLAEEQVRKIERLGEMGWPLRRVNATASAAARIAGASVEAEAAWESDVAGPSAAAVEEFLPQEIVGQQDRHVILVPRPHFYS